MPDWPTLPAGAGYPLVDATTGEFLSDAVNDALADAFVSLAAGLDSSGVTNNGAAIQALIDAYAAAGRELLLPPGTYNMGTTSLGLPEGAAIGALASGPYRFGDAGVTLRWSSSKTGTAVTVNAGNVSLSNITIDGSGASATGLLALGGFECRYSNVRVIDFDGIGHRIRAISNTAYQNVYVDNCGTSSLAAVQIDSVSHSLNTLDMSGLHIERQVNTALQIGPSSLAGSDIVPEFLRFYGLHIESVTDNGGTANTGPLVLVTLSRNVDFVAPMIFGGPGPLIKHAALTSHPANGILGGIRIIGGTLIGKTDGDKPANLVELETGTKFHIIGTRLENATGAGVLIDSTYGATFYMDSTCVFNDTGSLVADNRASRNYQIEQGDHAFAGHIVGYGGAPSFAAQAAAGTGAPTPTGTALDDTKGIVFLGSGSGAAAGAQCRVTFARPYLTQPVVVVGSNNGSTAALGLYVATTETFFDVYALNAPASSQSLGTFQFAYHVIG